MVHLERGTIPRKMRYASTEIPASLGSLDPRQEYVRQGDGLSAELGKQWIVHSNELAIRVPSSLIPDEDNILLNPVHPDYAGLQWDSVPFEWDLRLLGTITASTHR